MSEYFPKPISFGGSVGVKLELSNYATKADFKNATGVDTSKFGKKVDLASLKFDVDKLDIDELKNVPINLSNLKSKLDRLDVDKLVPVSVDLSKLSDVAKNDVVKKDVHYAKIKNIEDNLPDITNLATNTTLKAKLNEVKNEIHRITNSATTTTALNGSIGKVKNKIPNIDNLATTTALTAVKSKISNVSNLAKKTGFNTKISEIEKKVTTDHDHELKNN